MKNLKLLPIICLLTFQGIAQEGIQLKGKELFGDIKARQIGPAIMSGRISDIAASITNTPCASYGRP